MTMCVPPVAACSSAPACGLLLVASCASIVSKTAYPVAITSQPDQADISIADETGKASSKNNLNKQDAAGKLAV